MLLRERIKELRQTKHVPIECFVKNGISKNKYYRFVSGEGTITVGDLKKILDILTIDFSELMADSDERNSVIFNEFDAFQEVSDEELNNRKQRFGKKYMQTNLSAYYLASTTYELLISERSGAVDTQLVDDLYNDLNRQKFFTIFELQIFRVIAPHLSVSRFFNLYGVFLVSIRTYDTYAPADGLELMVKIHLLALKHALSSVNRAQKYLKFVVDGISMLNGQMFTSEFAIMKRFASVIRMYMDNRVEDADIAFDSFNGSARRLNMTKLWVSKDLETFEYFWKRLRSVSPASIAPSEKAPSVQELGHVDFSTLSMGEAFKLVMQLKKVSAKQFELVGFNHSKIYRLRHDLAQMNVEDLLAGMIAARLDVRDVDVYLTTSDARTTGSTPVRSQRLTIDELRHEAERYSKLADETGLDRDRELEFKYRILAIKASTGDWVATEESLALADEIKQHLSKFDEWHESQHRLAAWLFMTPMDNEEIRNQMRGIMLNTRNVSVFRYPYNPVLVNLNMAFGRAILRRDVDQAKFLYQQMLAAYESGTHVNEYFTYRWHKIINNQLVNVISYDTIMSIAIEGLLHDVLTLTGQKNIVEPYFDLLWQMELVYPTY